MDLEPGIYFHGMSKTLYFIDASGDATREDGYSPVPESDLDRNALRPIRDINEYIANLSTVFSRKVVFLREKQSQLEKTTSETPE